MKKWLRRVRGAVRMGLIWAVGWGLVGFLIELIQEFVPGWNGALVDIWPVALALLVALTPVLLALALLCPFASSVRRFFKALCAGAIFVWSLNGLVVAIEEENRNIRIRVI